MEREAIQQRAVALSLQKYIPPARIPPANLVSSGRTPVVVEPQLPVVDDAAHPVLSPPEAVAVPQNEGGSASEDKVVVLPAAQDAALPQEIAANLPAVPVTEMTEQKVASDASVEAPKQEISEPQPVREIAVKDQPSIDAASVAETTSAGQSIQASSVGSDNIQSVVSPVVPQTEAAVVMTSSSPPPLPVRSELASSANEEVAVAMKTADPAPQPEVKPETEPSMPQPVQAVVDEQRFLPVASPPQADNDSGVRPEVMHAWELQLQTLEQENQAMRQKLRINEADRLSDIKVDVVSQIHEEVFRARIAELERALDKANMIKRDDASVDFTTMAKHGKKRGKTEPAASLLIP